MKILSIASFLFCFLVFAEGFAQRRYPCEVTRIGRAITKPLMKDGKIDYSLAITSKEDKRNNDPDGVSIIYDDSLHETYINRYHVCNEDTTLNLLMVYQAADDECYYQLTFIFTGDAERENKIDAIVLNGQGLVRQHYGEQKEVDDLLTRYFK